MWPGKFYILLLGMLLAAGAADGQQFQHQFHETPSPDANVIVIAKSLRREADGFHSVSGRVFNRGLKPAKSVRVSYEVRDAYGVMLASGSAYTLPDEIPATSYADFRQRLLWRVDPREVTLSTKTEWSQ